MHVYDRVGEDVKKISSSCHEKFITPLTGGVTVMSPVFIFPMNGPNFLCRQFPISNWCAVNLTAKVLIYWIRL